MIICLCVCVCVAVYVFCRRGCGRKRKGTPVKVFVTHTEESVPEHRVSSGVCVCLLFVCCVCCICMQYSLAN